MTYMYTVNTSINIYAEGVTHNVNNIEKRKGGKQAKTHSQSFLGSPRNEGVKNNYITLLHI